MKGIKWGEQVRKVIETVTDQERERARVREREHERRAAKGEVRGEEKSQEERNTDKRSHLHACASRHARTQTHTLLSIRRLACTDKHTLSHSQTHTCISHALAFADSLSQTNTHSCIGRLTFAFHML